MSRTHTLGGLLSVLLALSGGTSFAGRNAGGALIVHTEGNVSYTAGTQPCGELLREPTTCEAAVTTIDKNGDTPALIWLLAAFPDTANPAVSAVDFGVQHSLAHGGGFLGHGYCGPAGSMEAPDAGWPDAGGNHLTFGSAVRGETLFSFYWFAAHGDSCSYLGTTAHPARGYASFIDDSDPPVEDAVTRFGVARWRRPGVNQCPLDPALDGEPSAARTPDAADTLLVNVSTGDPWHRCSGKVDTLGSAIAWIRNPHRDPANGSEHVFRSRLARGGYRAECYTQEMATFETAYRYRWTYYLPDTLLAADLRWRSLGQWTTYPCAPSLCEWNPHICQGRDGVFDDMSVVRGGRGEFLLRFRWRAEPSCKTFLMPLREDLLNRWIRFQMDIYWTNTMSGWTRLWIDGALVAEYSGIKTLPDYFPGGACNIQWSVGIYGPLEEDAQAPYVDVYVDDMSTTRLRGRAIPFLPTGPGPPSPSR